MGAAGPSAPSRAMQLGTRAYPAPHDGAAPAPVARAGGFEHWRPAVPRFVLSTLLASGALCLAGVAGAPGSARSEPLLGLAVNAVAVLHYWFILRVRARPSGHAAADEQHVDELRHGDWACTLFFLYLHFHASAARLGAPDPPLFSGLVGALLQPPLVLLGALGRFLGDELRARGWRRWAAAAAYLLSCVLFGLALYNLLDCLLRVPESAVRAGEPHAGHAARAAHASALDPLRAVDAARLLAALALTQLGYPLLALLQICWRACEPGGARPRERRPLLGWGVSPSAPLEAPAPLPQYPERLSELKDLGYGLLDVVVKGGVALYSGLLG